MPSVDWRRFTLKKNPLVDRDRKQYPSVQSSSTDQVNVTGQYRPAYENLHQMSAPNSRPSTSHHPQTEQRDFSYQSSRRLQAQELEDEFSDAAGEPLASDRAVDLIPRSAKPLVSRNKHRKSVGENSVKTKAPSTALNHIAFGDVSRRASEPSRGQGESKNNNKSKSAFPRLLNIIASSH
jgi:hypothetical protein